MALLNMQRKGHRRDIVKVYEGETGRSARLRGGEHLKDLEKKREKKCTLQTQNFGPPY